MFQGEIHVGVLQHLEPRGHDPHHGVRTAGHGDPKVPQPLLRPKGAGPKLVAHNGHGIPPGPVFLRQNGAAQEGHHTKNGKELPGHGKDDSPSRLGPSQNGGFCRKSEGGDSLEAPGLVAEVVEVGEGEGLHIPIQPVLPDHHQLLVRRERKGSKEDPLHQAEGNGGGTYSKGQGEGGNEGEGRISAEGPPGEVKVPGQAAQGASSPVTSGALAPIGNPCPPLVRGVGGERFGNALGYKIRDRPHPNPGPPNRSAGFQKAHVEVVGHLLLEPHPETFGKEGKEPSIETV